MPDLNLSIIDKRKNHVPVPGTWFLLFLRFPEFNFANYLIILGTLC